ncbi:MAG: hypothetical protein KTR32_12115 [Granulosicoccus sp.]|nr:hypothetical protein [Granulosicoccus sp.]
MELLQQLLQNQHAPTAMMILGGSLAGLGGYKVIRKGLSVAFWFALASIGWGSLMYGFKGSDFDFLTAATNPLSSVSANVSKLTPDLSNEVLDVLCLKLRDMAGG